MADCPRLRLRRSTARGMQRREGIGQLAVAMSVINAYYALDVDNINDSLFKRGYTTIPDSEAQLGCLAVSTKSHHITSGQHNEPSITHKNPTPTRVRTIRSSAPSSSPNLNPKKESAQTKHPESMSLHQDTISLDAETPATQGNARHTHACM
jgi:hypothetical protein